MVRGDAGVEHEHKWEWNVGSAWFVCSCGDKCEAVPIATHPLGPSETAALHAKVRTLEVALVAGNRVSTVALEALGSIGKNTCGREPLAAAYARGVLEELSNPG
jgi:hypothetical protein